MPPTPVLMEGLYKKDADIGDRNKLILACEEAISIENSAWMTEVVKEHHQRER